MPSIYSRLSRTVGIYAEDLGVYTSSTPAREMLKELITLRSEDHFTFIFRKGSLSQDWAKAYLQQLPSDRVTAFELPWSRRTSNIRSLLGFAETERTLPKADVYLRFDVGGLGVAGNPLVDGIADLSALNAQQSSMAWHGRVLFRRALHRTIQRGGDTVVISEATRKDVLDHFPTAQGRFHIVPNGIAREWFELGADDSDEMEDAWIWYGQVTPRKNLNGLIAAYARLLADGGSSLPRLKLVTKPGPGADELAALVRMRGLVEAVEFVDPLPLLDLIYAVRSSRGLVFPSFYEGFGMPIAEAMACGRPVLTSDTTSMPEVAGGQAILCDPHSQDSLVNGLRLMLNQELDCCRHRDERRRCASKYTTLRAAQAYDRLIDRVIEGEATEIR